MASYLSRKNFISLTAVSLAALAAGSFISQVGEAARTRRAMIDRNRCLPWDGEEACTDCADACAQPEKAIQWKPITLLVGSSLVTLQRPTVNAKTCMGCGACAELCTAQGGPAVQFLALDE